MNEHALVFDPVMMAYRVIKADDVDTYHEIIDRGSFIEMLLLAAKKVKEA